MFRNFQTTIIAMLLVLPLFGRTVEVCPDCDISSIKQGIEAASECDTIIVRGGTYTEGNIVVNKSLHLIGLDYPILDGLNETEILTITADHVTVDGFQIQNVGTSYLEDRAGLRVVKSKYFDIRNNRLLNTFFGIYLAHSNDGVVSNNEVVGEAVEEMSSGNAIHLWYCKRILVEGNLVRHHRDGIYFEFVDNSLIRNNISEENLRYGLHFMFSNEDDYCFNEFKNNGAGVAVMFSKKINMWENIFQLNWGTSSYGLLLKEIYDAEIYNNIFQQNTIGIYLEGTTRIKYKQNDFVNNGWAIKISGGCVDNVISENNFISNTFDIALNSESGSNSFDGNYWSEYAGYDLNYDGVGDVAYRPVKLFNYVVHKTPEAMVLLRSFFIDIINFSEKVSPIFTPQNVLDNLPSMTKLN
jgi:nitrous oxidase accessory protein